MFYYEILLFLIIKNFELYVFIINLFIRISEDILDLETSDQIFLGIIILLFFIHYYFCTLFYKLFYKIISIY